VAVPGFTTPVHAAERIHPAADCSPQYSVSNQEHYHDNIRVGTTEQGPVHNLVRTKYADANHDASNVNMEPVVNFCSFKCLPSRIKMIRHSREWM
jgi:hypothetical protein